MPTNAELNAELKALKKEHATLKEAHAALARRGKRGRIGTVEDLLATVPHDGKVVNVSPEHKALAAELVEDGVCLCPKGRPLVLWRNPAHVDPEED